MPKNFIIFTDLDGTLLDHDTYSYTPAYQALEKLRKTKTPLILASSKTTAEVAPLRHELGFDDYPAIVENGAGILVPNSHSVSTLSDYEKIVEIINSAPANLRSKYIGFNDWSADEICDQTSLSLRAAKLAKQREYSEPGVWIGTPNEQILFQQYLSKNGLRAQQGGRFLTLSFGAGKVDKMNDIVGSLTSKGEYITTVALGDAPNDIQMLEHADIGFVMTNKTNHNLFTSKKPDHITYSTKAGPHGWNACVLSLFA